MVVEEFGGHCKCYLFVHSLSQENNILVKEEAGFQSYLN